jgi:membrane protein CcdC involved in cytochrome C biogenesis
MSSVSDLRSAAAAHARAYATRQSNFFNDSKALILPMILQAVVAMALTYPSLLFTTGSEVSEAPLDWGVLFLRFLILAAFWALSGLTASACRTLPPSGGK